jgi:hypothetical protein
MGITIIQVARIILFFVICAGLFGATLGAVKGIYSVLATSVVGTAGASYGLWGMDIIPQSQIWVLQRGGVFWRVVRQGPIFIWRGFVQKRGALHAGDIPKPLFKKGQQVDLTDTPVTLDVTVIFRVEDAERVIYVPREDVGNTEEATLPKANGEVALELTLGVVRDAFQSYLKDKDLAEVRHLKGVDIASAMGVVRVPIGPNTAFVDLIGRWGLVVIAVIINDVQTPPVIQQAQEDKIRAGYLLEIDRQRRTDWNLYTWETAKRLVGIIKDDVGLTPGERDQIAAKLPEAMKNLLQLKWTEAMQDLQVLGGMPGINPAYIQTMLSGLGPVGSGPQSRRGGNRRRTP